MTIHNEHPFATPPQDRDPLRQLRGRMPAGVTIWTTGSGRRRQGWTLSSVLLADGDPDPERADDDPQARYREVIGLLDEDSDLADVLEPGTDLVINLLPSGTSAAALADAFARLAPAPGGPFTVGDWADSPAGPRLSTAAGWIHARVLDASAHAGWALLVRARVLSAEVGRGDVLRHEHGRYH